MSKTIYVSYGTEDYLPRLMKMVKSLMKQGIPSNRIDVQECDIQGNWHKRVKAKVAFMQEMADKYPKNNIAWVDADCVCVQFPEFLETFDGEWGMAREPRHGRYDNWYLSNCYIIKPTDKSKQMLAHWAYHTKHIVSRTPTQTAFNQCFEIHQPKLNLDFRFVPLSYCWYAKHSDKAPYNKIKPVFIHDIASRKTLMKR